MSFAPPAGRCKKCHIYVACEPGLVFIHEDNGCEHSGKRYVTGSIEMLGDTWENPDFQEQWIEFV